MPLYQPDGGGRDAFIFGDILQTKGKIGMIKSNDAYLAAKVNAEYWAKKDKQAQFKKDTIQDTSFPSMQSLRIPLTEKWKCGKLGEDEEEDVKAPQEYVESAPKMSSTFFKNEPFATFEVDEGEKQFRETLEKKAPVRIPGYSGHIPCSRDCIAVSTTSNRFMEEACDQYIQRYTEDSGMQTNSQLTNHKAQKKLSSLKMPSVQNLESNSALNKLHAEYTKSPTLQKLRTRELPECTHHIPGFQGHVPRSKYAQQVYQNNAEPTTFH